MKLRLDLAFSAAPVIKIAGKIVVTIQVDHRCLLSPFGIIENSRCISFHDGARIDRREDHMLRARVEAGIQYTQAMRKLRLQTGLPC